jgi:ribosomal protein L16/L10AE
MLQPKKTKYRRQQKGRMKGNAQRVNQLLSVIGIKQWKPLVDRPAVELLVLL